MHNLFLQNISLMSTKVFLVMTRIFSLFSYFNILNSLNMSIINKFLLVYLISNMLTYFIPDNYEYNIYTLDFLIVLFHQILMGIVMGSLFQFLIACTIFIGEIISSQIGLSFSIFFDLGHRVYSVVISQLLKNFFLFSFFIYNGHLYTIIFLIKSFCISSLNNPMLYRTIFLSVLNVSNIIFFYGVHFSLSFLFFFLILNVSIMVLNRLVPNTSLLSYFTIIFFFIGMMLLKQVLCNFLFLSKILINCFCHYLMIFFLK